MALCSLTNFKQKLITIYVIKLWTVSRCTWRCRPWMLYAGYFSLVM